MDAMGYLIIAVIVAATAGWLVFSAKQRKAKKAAAKPQSRRQVG